VTYEWGRLTSWLAQGQNAVAMQVAAAALGGARHGVVHDSNPPNNAVYSKAGERRPSAGIVIETARSC